MATNCAPLFADLLLHAYEAKAYEEPKIRISPFLIPDLSISL
jgi:hypothetical protein